MNLQLRVWKTFSIDEVKHHLLILGDSFADCGACKELGLDPWQVSSCPHCGIRFQFIASRRSAAHPGERFGIAKRILSKRPDLQFIDYDDFQKAAGSQAAKDFFSK